MLLTVVLEVPLMVIAIQMNRNRILSGFMLLLNEI